MNAPLPQGKVCTKCGTFRLLASFPEKSGRSDGRSSECKPCFMARKRARYARNPGPKVAKRKQFVADNHERLALQRRLQVESLSDAYIKKRLLAGTRLKSADLSAALIELKREAMCLRRLGRTMEQASQKETEG